MKNNSIIEVVFFLATSRPICGDFFSLCTKPSEHTTTAAATTTARATALAFISNCSCLSAAGQSHLLPNGMAHRIFHAVPCHAMPCRTLATQPPFAPFGPLLRRSTVHQYVALDVRLSVSGSLALCIFAFDFFLAFDFRYP